ncbi:retrovirus-related Pol polyprotein from transposon 412 [Trichonephila clavipes]|nr:retrovirus-related Pol polyprotein from transposon 412 [Trichonephila clavipes]
MKTRHQKPEESLQEYAFEMQRLTTLAFSDFSANVREMICLEYFVDGLKDEEIQMAPSWQDTAPFHPTTKRDWALWDNLHLRNDVLYRKWESDDGKTFRWQLILPKTRVSTVLKELHGSRTGGHFGIMKTLQKVRPGKRTRGRLQLYNVGAPFERIAFDILGPLPRSSDGNNNILVAMDYFPKWPEAYPIPDQEASTVAEVLVQH